MGKHRKHNEKQCVTIPVSEDGIGVKLSFGASTVQGWAKTQEDAHFCLPQFEANASLWGVFDGHNGAEVAKFAAKHLPSIILKNRNYKSGRIELGLQESFMQLDYDLLEIQSVPELMQMRREYDSKPITRMNAPAITSGCTAVVALIKNNVLYVANLGDSRCILSRNGEEYPMSVDHKPDDPPEKERVERAGGEVAEGLVNYGLNVSRAFGDHLYKRNPQLPLEEQMIIAWPDVKRESLRSNTDQFMVLICGGVRNSISNQDLIDFVSQRIESTERLSKICEDLFTETLPPVMPTGGIAGKENMTFMIVRFEPNQVKSQRARNQLWRPHKHLM